MERRTVTGLMLALLLTTATVWAFFVQERENSCIFPVMGTVCECRFEMKERDFKAAVNVVRAAFDEVMKIANLHNRDSELARLNASAHEKPFICSEELYYLLTKSREAYKISGGRFDISVKPLMDLWGFYRKEKRIPNENTLKRTRLLCGLDKVVFDDEKRSVFFPEKGMAFDLGGIAKGYALDSAVRQLAANGITIKRGVLNLGGNLWLFGSGNLCSIGIKDPSDPQKIKSCITLTSPGAVSSSGDYERYVVINKEKFGHIIDPISGTPAVRNHAATVFAKKGIDSDWMSTVLFLGGEDIKNKLDCQTWIVRK